MRGITVVLLIGLVLSLPIPALAKGSPLTDAQLESIAAQPEIPRPRLFSEAALRVEESRPPLASEVAGRKAQEGVIQTFVILSGCSKSPEGSRCQVGGLLQFRGAAYSRPSEYSRQSGDTGGLLQSRGPAYSRPASVTPGTKLR